MITNAFDHMAKGAHFEHDVFRASDRRPAGFPNLLICHVVATDRLEQPVFQPGILLAALLFSEMWRCADVIHVNGVPFLLTISRLTQTSCCLKRRRGPIFRASKEAY